MNISETLISFETAKLAKEKGFDEDVKNYYDGSGEMFTRLYKAYKGKYYQAPTQSLLQRWLREEHIVFVRPEWFWCFKSGSGKYQVFVDRDYENISGAYKVTFDTYEKALEKGLFEALKLIK